jgi:hypothetical protein
MPKHYGGNSNGNTHKMPDGTIMTGKKHTASSRPIKKKEKGVFSETEGKIKHGALRKALKVKGDEKLKRPELSRILKNTKSGEMFKYNNNNFKMTDLMRKRIQLAVNMMKGK